MKKNPLGIETKKTKNGIQNKETTVYHLKERWKRLLL